MAPPTTTLDTIIPAPTTTPTVIASSQIAMARVVGGDTDDDSLDSVGNLAEAWRQQEEQEGQQSVLLPGTQEVSAILGNSRLQDSRHSLSSMQVNTSTVLCAMLCYAVLGCGAASFVCLEGGGC